MQRIIDNKIYLISLLIGIISGIAALLLKNLVHFIGDRLVGNIPISQSSIWFFALPMVGIIITVLLVKYVIRADLGHGVTKVLESISLHKGMLRLHHTFSSMITSSFTIGFGGSVGAEAPVVLTGAAIGSNLSRFFRLSATETMLMLGCGATGAIAGIFKAPIAGVVFTLEVLMLDLTMSSLLPLLISAISAAVLAYYFMGDASLFTFHLNHNFNAMNVPFYLLTGVFAGIVSLYFIRVSTYFERKFKEMKHQFSRILLGGLALGVSIFLFPPLWGEGYISINKIFNGAGMNLFDNSVFYTFQDSHWFFLLYLLLLIIFKVLSMTATTASGGVGGVFAPSLFVGAVSGYLIAMLSNRLFGINLPYENFALAGMAAMVAGVMHAPMLGIFLAAEITGGYSLLFPLIIAAITSYVTINQFEPHSIYARRLAAKGILVTHHKDRAALHYMNVERLIEKDFTIVSPDMTLGDLTKAIAASKRDLFPVVDADGTLRGMLKMNDIRKIIFNTELYDNIHVRDLMYMPEFYISPHDSMLDVAAKFESCGRFNLAVIDNGKYVGFISRARVFSDYRDTVSSMSQE
ncbi:MAG: chloride channel protein [Bacteroidales bacterium]|nr:chloride channel protein [Bacteroidales bacterium]